MTQKTAGSTGEPDLYAASRLKRLFDEMSATYGVVNYISSFGFTHRWRRQCVHFAELRPGDRVCDLMTGMGECWNEIVRRTGGPGAATLTSRTEASLVAIDFSPVMIAAARKKAATHAEFAGVEIREQDVFQYEVAPTQRFDAIVCGFGVKTLAPEMYADLAQLLLRLLKPGGRFAFVEISLPPSPVLRVPLMLYLKLIIPWIGKFCLGNPDNYRMLGVYTAAFENASRLHQTLLDHGLRARYHRLFFGSATVVSGTTPEE